MEEARQYSAVGGRAPLPLTPRHPKWLWGLLAVLAPTLVLAAALIVLVLTLQESIVVAYLLGRYALTLGPLGAAAVLAAAYFRGRHKGITASDLQRDGAAAFSTAIVSIPITTFAPSLFSSRGPAPTFADWVEVTFVLIITLIVALILGVPVAVAHYWSLRRLAFRDRHSTVVSR